MANWLNHVTSCECALICNALNCQWQVERLAVPITSSVLLHLPLRHRVYKKSICVAPHLWKCIWKQVSRLGVLTQRRYNVEHSLSGYCFGDKRLHSDLQGCHRSQELWLCWKQLIPSGLEYILPFPHHQSLPCFKNWGDLKWKTFNL